MAQQFDHSLLVEQEQSQRATVFRVYNYYRVGLAFLFLYLFLDPNLNEFVGGMDPDLFGTVIVTYLAVNILAGVFTLFVRADLLASTRTALVVIVLDIVAITLMIYASGGVSSGLGNFLFFVLAFAGGLIRGRVSTLLPAIAFILTIYGESYLYFLNRNEIQGFFQAGILGIVYFVTNILFQTLSNQLRKRQSQVLTLEQINQFIIEGMRTGVVVTTENYETKMMNRAAERLLNLRNTNTSETQNTLPAVLRDVVADWKTDPLPQEISFTDNQSGNQLLANLSQLNSPSSESDTLIFLEDSTEVQRQAQQLKLASLGRLSASIAHEIRNPLGAVSHAAQLLLESGGLNSDDRRLCEIIQDHSLRMNQVIENVLQLSRNQIPDKLNLVLEEWLMGFVRDFTETRSDSLKITVDIDQPQRSVLVDPGHLSQVLSNLCENGAYFSEQATGKSRLLITGQVEPMTDTFVLDVVDYGQGVETHHIENLFEPFFTTQENGTGLGLYLARELCLINGLQLTYRPSDAGGSTFRISFNANQGDE